MCKLYVGVARAGVRMHREERGEMLLFIDWTTAAAAAAAARGRDAKRKRKRILATRERICARVMYIDIRV